MTVIRSIILHCQSGNADKIYALEVVQQADDTYNVNYGNGRRGSTLSTGTKAEKASFDRAIAIYEKTMKEKIGKGYRPIDGLDLGQAQASPAIATMEARTTEYAPQLANAFDEANLIDFMTSPSWIAQEKYDGERRGIIRPAEGNTFGANRKGLSVALAESLTNVFDRLPADTILDGEHVGDAVYLFDILRLAGEDLRGLCVLQRLDILNDLKPSITHAGNVHIAKTAKSTAEKIELLSRITENGGEGLVFKAQTSTYAEGRPNLGGAWLKHKLYKTLSAIVAHKNEQRSVGLELITDSGQRINVGNVTIPANHKVPPVGAVVEVRYLYAYEEGSLYQPVYLGERTDIDQNECKASQRAFKASVPLSQAA